MRDSQRRLIRQHIKTLLSTPAITGIGTKVFANRARLVFETELPNIIIYTKNEPSEKFVEAPREFKRSLNLEIEIQYRLNPPDEDTVNIDDAMDDIAEEVERRVLLDPTLNNLASDTLLDNTEMDIVQNGNQLIGSCKITFVVEYNQPVDYSENDDSLDDFETAHVEITNEPDNDQDPVVQDIELPQD